MRLTAMMRDSRAIPVGCWIAPAARRSATRTWGEPGGGAGVSAAWYGSGAVQAWLLVMSHAVRLRLFKLRVFDCHCHVVASHDERGEPVDAPGVDLRGADADAAFAAAAPLLEMLRARAGGVEMRSLSVHLERRRLIATFGPEAGARNPAVLRVDDGADLRALLAAAGAVMAYLADRVAARLAQRRTTAVALAAEGASGAAPVADAPVITPLTVSGLQHVATRTLEYYDSGAESFWQGTRGHDVSQNIAALLRHLSGDRPQAILDLGCGPGRDLKTFRDLGHTAIGLDGALRFVEMARAHSGCEVWHQNLLELELPARRFDGIFANASLFHVPSQALPRVLLQLRAALRQDGTLFVSNPHGDNREGWSGDRYGCYLDLATFRGFMTRAGFSELEHYYRPQGQPRERQPWLASIWRA